MPTGPKKTKLTTQGGSRSNAGRKSIKKLTESEFAEFVKALRKREKLEDKSIWDLLLDSAYNATDWREKHGALRMVVATLSAFATKHTEQDVNVTSESTFRAYMPKEMPDPAKLIALPGRKQEKQEANE